MTLGSFIVRNTFRNKRRSLLTMLSISFSLLLLTLMISIWRTFYIDVGAPLSAQRLITRDRVSLAFLLPGYYRDKIRSIPGVVAVAPMTWFGGRYKNDRPENFFAQVATDPDEYLKVASDKIVSSDQAAAWQHDRAGALVDVTLANKYGWKIGDKITLLGTIFPVNPELTIRGIYHRDPPQNSLYFNAKYLEESLDWFKGRAGWYATQVASPARCGASGRRNRQYVSQRSAADENRERESLSTFVHSDAGQRESLYSRDLRRGGVCHPAGFRQHHGHVGTQPYARSSRPENFGIHPPACAVDLRIRGGGSRSGRRFIGNFECGVIDPVVDALLDRTGNSYGYESDLAFDGFLAADRGGGGIFERICSRLRRIAHKYCGGTAPHWLTSLV